MWLRLNGKKETRIINLDKVVEIYFDDDKVSIKFEGNKYILFLKQNSPDEYETLQEYFEANQLESLIIDL